MYVCMYIYTSDMYVYAYIYIYTYIHTHTHTYMQMHIRTYKQMHVEYDMYAQKNARSHIHPFIIKTKNTQNRHNSPAKDNNMFHLSSHARVHLCEGFGVPFIKFCTLIKLGVTLF